MQEEKKDEGHPVGLSPEELAQTIEFLVTWTGVSPDEARERLTGYLPRAPRACVQRRIYPPGAKPGAAADSREKRSNPDPDAAAPIPAPASSPAPQPETHHP